MLSFLTSKSFVPITHFSRCPLYLYHFNFDNLLADALSIYTKTFPLVCGHESLTGYIRSNLRRPLIAKIHRDLLLAPLSNPEEISMLPKEWEGALKKIFNRFTPIVIGYGGNDGSLMGFLKKITPIDGGIFWCHVSETIDSNVQEVVEHHRGCIVPIVGFDELMLQLQEKLELQFLLPQLEKYHKERVAEYQKQFENITDRLSKKADSIPAEEARKHVRQAAKEAVKRLAKEKDWWSWKLRASAESDPAKSEAIYIAGLEEFPENASLTSDFAIFMSDVRKNYDEAERLFRRALEIDPNEAAHTGNLAIFMNNVRKNYDEAERLYRRGLELGPNDATNIGNFAIFMENVRKNYDEAERLFRRALEIDPNSIKIIGNFAVFMYYVRKNYDESERLFRRALEIDPNNIKITQNFALFMVKIHKNYDEADRLFRRTLKLDPNNATNIGNFAVFMYEVRKNHDEAERLFRRALEIDPNNTNNIGNFAVFMDKVRKKYNEAERLYRRALKLDPNNAIYIGNLAGFLLAQRKDGEGLKKLDLAIQLLSEQTLFPAGLDVELWFYAYANGRKDMRAQALSILKNLLIKKGSRSPAWDFSENIKRAKKDEHPAAMWLHKLATVINEEANPTTLDEWTEWRNTIT